MPLLKDDSALSASALLPAAKILDPEAAPGDLAYVAGVYNRIGGLLDRLAEQLSLDVTALLTLYLAQSRGQRTEPGGLFLRIEANRLFNRWGQEVEILFDRHFRFGGHGGVEGAAWQNQQWRREPEGQWVPVHVGSSAREEEVFAFACELAGEEVASLASAFGESLLPGQSFALLGYDSAAALHRACRASERWQALGLCDLLVGEKQVTALRDQDWRSLFPIFRSLTNVAAAIRRFSEAHEAVQEFQSLPREAPGSAVLTREELYAVDTDKTATLTLRDGPVKGAQVALLHGGEPLLKLSEDETASAWWLVQADVGGETAEGWVQSAYLTDFQLPDAASRYSLALPAAHMSRAKHGRSDGFGRLYPLNEDDLHEDRVMPARRATDPAVRAKELAEIAAYLDPADKDHARYEVSGSFLPVYAYDLACLARAYLPRVWWTDRALTALGAGQLPRVVYGLTVREMTVNQLFDWLQAFGEDFGWQRTFDLDRLQKAANAGALAMIVAQRRALDQPGQLAALLPESEAERAVRDRDSVVRPLQTMANMKDRKPGPATTRWWQTKEFRDFGFWYHA
ncbi:MAG: N-acetylmuramidase domain-containing protein [Pseudomonadota bacterium]